jgi:hypothetical protein
MKITVLILLLSQLWLGPADADQWVALWTWDGEIWVTSDPPQYAGSFTGPVPTTGATFGGVKGIYS